MADAKKNAARDGRTIVFVDESGLSERPHRVRTWAPRGKTPVLQYHFRWKTLSVIAGMTLWRVFFRLYPGTIRTPQAVDFLRRLLRQIPGKLLVIWDRLGVHRSRNVWALVDSLKGRLHLEFLPAYAPELNPVEYLFAHCKGHELANFCPDDLWELSAMARRAFGKVRHRPTLITACWKQAKLF